MTVKELITYLKTFDPKLEVIETRYSDYRLMEKTGISLAKAVKRSEDPTEWIMRVDEHDLRTMSEENRAKVKTFLHFDGN